MVTIIQVILGTVLLLAGCEIFWLFLGIAGFIAGFKIAQAYFPATTPMTAFIIAGGGGILGILITLFFQTVAISLAGFMAGAYIVAALCGPLNCNVFWQGIFIIFGGTIGAGMMAVYFEWALVWISSLAGAALIVQVIPTNIFIKAVIFCVLAAIGIIAQTAEKNAHAPASTGNKKSRIKAG